MMLLTGPIGVVVLQVPPRSALISADIVVLGMPGGMITLPLIVIFVAGFTAVPFAVIFDRGKSGAIALFERKSLSHFPAAFEVPSYLRSSENISQLIFSTSVMISYSELFLSPSI